MKRCIFKLARRILLFLLSGAIINVAVAWGCSLFVPPAFVDYHEVGAIDPSTGKAVFAWINERPTRFSVTNGIGNDEHGRWGTPYPPPTGLPRWATALAKTKENELLRDLNAWGWPLVAVCFEWRTENNNPNTVHAVGGFRVPFLPRESNGHPIPRRVPLIPIWPNVAINTIFYAAILWVLVGFPFTLRRWRRIKRGLCPACAYPIGESSICTECGKPIAFRAVTGTSR